MMEKNLNKNTEKEPHKKGGKIGLIFGGILLLILLAGGLLFAVRPAFVRAALCGWYLKNLSEDRTLQMQIDADTAIGDHDFSIAMELKNTEASDGSSITAAELEHVDFYYADGMVYLENGSVWSVSELCPDYEELTGLLKTISGNADIIWYREDSADCYEFTSADENAENLMKMLCPTETSDLVKVTGLDIEIKVIKRKVSEIDFSGEAVLASGSAITLQAVCSVIPEASRTEVQIPDAVLASIAAKDTADAPAITPELLNLLLRMGNTITADPLTADISLEADAGLIDLNTDFTYIRSTSEGQAVNEIIFKGKEFYFDDPSDVEDADGSSADDSLAEMAQTTGLIDQIWNLCMTSGTDISTGNSTSEDGEDGKNGRVYTINLPDETMQQTALAIFPALSDTDITFTNGSVTLTTDDTRVTEISLTFDGSVKILIAQASAGLSARITFR